MIDLRKLEITELYCKPCMHVKPSEAGDFTATQHEPLKQREKAFRGMLKSLIRTTEVLERESPKDNIFFLMYSDTRSMVEKATGKTWEEIRSLTS